MPASNLEAREIGRASLANRIYTRSRLTGEFVLRSGAISHEYFDKYQFESDPALLFEIAAALIAHLPARVDALAGLELGGVPLAVACAQRTGLRTLFVRKHAKEYGTRRLAEGGQVAGKTLVVIEDVVTSGGQVIESCQQLRDAGAEIARVLCVIDREAGGVQNLEEHRLELKALYTLSDLIREAASPDALIASDASLAELVEAVRAIPYGRPSDRTVEGMLRERRGTCSAKHLFLARTLGDRFPETEPELVHRVYTLSRVRARQLFGEAAAELVPDQGLVDVHRYLTAIIDGRRIEIDATFPRPSPWDGRSPLPLACAEGQDYVVGQEPDAEKLALEAQYCDASIREPFIAALTTGMRAR